MFFNCRAGEINDMHIAMVGIILLCRKSMNIYYNIMYTYFWSRDFQLIRCFEVCFSNYTLKCALNRYWTVSKLAMQ